MKRMLCDCVCIGQWQHLSDRSFNSNNNKKKKLWQIFDASMKWLARNEINYFFFSFIGPEKCSCPTGATANIFSIYKNSCGKMIINQFCIDFQTFSGLNWILFPNFTIAQFIYQIISFSFCTDISCFKIEPFQYD